MARVERKVEVPATTSTEVDVTCDGCGAVEPKNGWSAPPSPEAQYFRSSEFEVTIEARTTMRVTVEGKTSFVGYEGDGEEAGVAWDFCPSCFKTKVRPLLETIAKPRKIKVSW